MYGVRRLMFENVDNYVYRDLLLRFLINFKCHF